MTTLRSPRLVLLWLALAGALLLRATIPFGWMPVSTGGGIRMVICSGNGAVEIVSEPGLDAMHKLHHAGMDHRGAGSHDGTRGHDAPRDPCPFGVALAKVFDLPAPAAEPAAMMEAADPLAPQAVTARVVAARGLRPPARGPPRFA